MPDDDSHGNVNCKNCTNCVYCDGCVNCVGCTNCVNCINMTQCVGCKECVNCSQCDHCEECANCSRCDECNKCSNCNACVDCHHCSQCHHCHHCSYCYYCQLCKHCHNCHHCVYCDHSENCQHCINSQNQINLNFIQNNIQLLDRGALEAEAETERAEERRVGRIREAREEYARRQAEEQPEITEYVNPCLLNEDNDSIIENSECEGIGITDSVTQERIPSGEGYCIGKQCHALSSIRNTIDHYRYFREPSTRRFFTKEELVAAGIITEDVDYIDSDEEARSEALRLSDEEAARGYR